MKFRVGVKSMHPWASFNRDAIFILILFIFTRCSDLVPAISLVGSAGGIRTIGAAPTASTGGGGVGLIAATGVVAAGPGGGMGAAGGVEGIAPAVGIAAGGGGGGGGGGGAAAAGSAALGAAFGAPPAPALILAS